MTPKGDAAVWLSYVALVAVSFGVMRRTPAPSTVRPISEETPTEQTLTETRVPARLWQDPIQAGWDRMRNITGTGASAETGTNTSTDKLRKLWETEGERIAQAIGDQDLKQTRQKLVRELSLKRCQQREHISLVSSWQGTDLTVQRLQKFIEKNKFARKALDCELELTQIEVCRELAEEGLLEIQDDRQTEAVFREWQENIDRAFREIAQSILPSRAGELAFLDVTEFRPARIESGIIAIDATTNNREPGIETGLKNSRKLMKPLTSEASFAERTVRRWIEKSLADQAAQIERSEATIKKELAAINKELKTRRLLILPIVVSGRNYPEDLEDRLRARYAVGAAMKHLGYTPQKSSHLDFFPVPIGKSGEVLLSENGKVPVDSEDAEYVPITREIYQTALEVNVEGGEVRKPKIVIFWIDSRLCDLRGGQRYENVKKTVDAVMNGIEGAEVTKCMTLLGSDNLAGLLKRKNFPKCLQLWYPISSATPNFLMREAGIESIGKEFNIYRTTPTDSRLMTALAREIMLRTRCRGRAPTTWFIAEHDTLYSRSMANVLRETLAKEFRQDPEKLPLRHVSYLRGLDGNLPDAPVNEGEKPKAMPSSFPGLIQQLMNRRVSTHRVQGRRQVDYIQRLAIALQKEDRLKSKEKQVKAICVMGSDVYDKLMILQSFRPLFPGAVFYTTGLDALYLQPEAAVAARNLVVVAPFGLESDLDQDNNGISHSFRNSAQTAIFDAVVEFVGGEKNDACRPMKVWEVGRNQFHPLKQVGGDWGCWLPEQLSGKIGDSPQLPEKHADACALSKVDPETKTLDGAAASKEARGSATLRRGNIRTDIFLSLSIPFLFLVLATYILEKGVTGVRTEVCGFVTKCWKSLKRARADASNTGVVSDSSPRQSGNLNTSLPSFGKQRTLFSFAIFALLGAAILDGWYGWKLSPYFSAGIYVPILVLLAVAILWHKFLRILKPIEDAPDNCGRREARARRYGFWMIWLSLAAWIAVCSIMVIYANQDLEEPIAPTALSDGVSIWLTSIIRFGAVSFGLAALIRMGWQYIISASRLERATSDFKNDASRNDYSTKLYNKIQRDVAWYTGGLCGGTFRVPTYIWLSAVTSVGLLILCYGVFRIMDELHISSPLLIPARGALAMDWSKDAFVLIMTSMLALVAAALVQHALLSIFLSRLRMRMERASKNPGKVAVIPASFAEALSEHAGEVSRFVVVPFAVMVLFVASTHALFDAWSVPSSMWFTLSALFTAMLFSAFALHRQAAALKKSEQRRIIRHKRGAAETPRERASDMWDDQIGIFGSWTQQPVVRALLIVGAGIGITFVEPLLGM